MRSTVILAATAGLCWTSPAIAATLVVESGPLASTVIVAPFDPSLGTLTNIRGEVTGTASFNIRTDTATATGIDYTVRNYFGIYFGPIYFDATGLATGTGNIAGSFLPVTTTSNGVHEWSTSTSFAVFSEPGGVTGTITADYPYQIMLSGGVLAIPGGEFGPRLGAIRITYTYTPFGGEVPEPATWMAMIAGFGAIGAALRRRQHGLART